MQRAGGEELVKRYEGPDAPPGGIAFCSKCGSLVANVSVARVSIPGGCLDNDPAMKPRAHLHVASMAPWFSIEDGVPQSNGDVAPH